MKRFLQATTLAVVAAGPAALAQPPAVCRPDAGRPAQGGADDTAAIQRVLDRCTGGTVALAAGTWRSGPLVLRDRETLRLEQGAVLTASADPARYAMPGRPGKAQPFLLAEGVGNVAFEGPGTIDGQGQAAWAATRSARGAGSPPPPRPVLVAFRGVSDGRVTGITLRNAPAFNLVIQGGKRIVIDGLTVRNPADSPNTDGIDLIDTQGIIVRNADIDTGDDHIAIKADKPGANGTPGVHDVLIENSRFGSGHGVSIGSDTQGGIADVTVRRISITGARIGLRIKTRKGRGGDVGGVLFQDVCLKGVGTAIQVSAFYQDHRSADQDAPGPASAPAIHDIRFERVTGDGGRQIGLLSGRPEQPLRNIAFDHVLLSAAKGLLVENAQLVLTGSKLVSADGNPVIRNAGAQVRTAP